MPLLNTLEDFCYKSHLITQGSTLLKEGEKTDTTYVLICGELRVTTGDVEIGVFSEPGDTFGEMANLMEDVVSANVEAVTDCQVYIIKDLKMFLLKNPKETLELLKASYTRLKQMNKGVNLMLQMIP
ncbi:MAG: cyclic nucleotide-binding domain-containing protein [Lentisphaerales bacterium]|nr:cyclic nucleotide-binding domain-containing protein [Lentisphaerales bacterium]